MSSRLILELPHHRFVSRIIERAALRRAGEGKLILHRPHVMIEVSGPDLLHEGGRVGEEKIDVVIIFLHHHVVLEPNVGFDMRYESVLRT